MAAKALFSGHDGRYRHFDTVEIIYNNTRVAELTLEETPTGIMLVIENLSDKKPIVVISSKGCNAVIVKTS